MMTMDDLELTDPCIRRSFDERSFERGERYYRQGRVISAVRFGDTIWGMVEGRRAEPYRVTVEPHLDGLLSRCSCPVGSRCKHGVALALRWLEEPGSFVDGEAIIEDLGGRSREDLVDLAGGMIRSDPSQIPSFERAILLLDASRGEAGMERIGRATERALDQGLNYYSIEGVVEDLREVLGIARHLADAERWQQAAETCLLVVEACLDAYKRGADDSSGTLGELVGDATRRFNICMDGVGDDPFRDSVLHRVLSLHDRAVYGVEVDGLFYGLVTEGNIDTVTGELVRRTGKAGEREGEDRHHEHRLESVEELVSDLRRSVEEGG